MPDLVYLRPFDVPTCTLPVQKGVISVPYSGKQRKFHKFMNEMSVTQTRYFDDPDKLKGWGPTKGIVRLVDKKGRVSFVPVEHLQREVPTIPIEPGHMAVRFLADGRVVQRRDNAMTAGPNGRWFIAGSDVPMLWENVFPKLDTNALSSLI